MLATLEKTLQADVPFFVPQLTDANIRLMNAVVAEKLFFGDPTLYDVLGGNIGSAREALFVAMLQESGRRVEASPDERSADFVLDDGRTFEIGGRGKQRKGADVVVRDDLDVPSGSSLPLWTFGFLY